MIAFAVGLLVGIGLSCVVAWFAASQMQAEFDDTEACLRHSRDELSDALKERNDRLYQEFDKVAELQKEVAELRNLRGKLIHGLRELLGEQ